MTSELQERLYKDFPELFQEKDLPMTETCMCWGIECGDGWEPILRNMCNMLKYKGTRSLRLKDPFPYAYKLHCWFSTVSAPVLRWLERRLKLHYYKLRIPNPCDYEVFPGWGVKFTQIKEKFGTLRVYYDVYPKFTEEQAARFDKEQVSKEHERFYGYADGVISFTEHLSSKTCERDGHLGALVRYGWWRTLCSECREKHSNSKLNAKDAE
jgi:hypothetical protein